MFNAVKTGLLSLTAVSIAISLVGCGGGGSGTSVSEDASNDKFVVKTQTTYTSAATAGELVSYVVNPVDLTYSYEITKSAYGKTGEKGNGTLTKNADGSYTPSGMTGKIRLNENGTMIGVITEDFDGNGTPEDVPVFGVSNPLKSFQDAAGEYNFVSYNCSGANCYANYGTFKVEADGSWQSCNSADLRDGIGQCQNPQSGTSVMSTVASGQIQILDRGGNGLGTLVTHKDVDSGQRLMFIDIAHTATNGFGNGIIVGSEIASPTLESVQGTWIYMNSQTGAGTLVVSEGEYTDSAVGATPISLSMGQPWDGFATTGNGYTVLMAGTGMFAASYTSGGTETISIGVRVK
jgi:hypothetical protein